MAKMTGTLYPRGFLIPDAKDTSIIRLDNHREVTVLYETFISGGANPQGWAFRKRVFPVAMEVFHDFKNFLACQVNNPFLYGYNYEFLLDTLSFIAGNRRRLSHGAWLGLLADKTEATTIRKQERLAAAEAASKGLVLSTPAIIAKWCSREGGYEDLIITMSTMFSNVRPSETPPNQVVNWYALRGLSE